MDTTTSMEYSDCVQSKTGKSAVYDEIFRVVETLPISQRERENVVKQIIEIIERERADSYKQAIRSQLSFKIPRTIKKDVRKAKKAVKKRG